MFWVESRLRVCTWDPAHGKPYASAQLELSFGVGGLGPVSTQAPYKWSLRDLNCILIALLWSHQRREMLSSALVSSRNKMSLYVTPTQRSKVSGVSSF